MVGCSSLEKSFTSYGTSYENLKKAVLIDGCEALGAIVDDDEVITVNHISGIEEEYGRYLYTFGDGAFSGLTRFPWRHIHTYWIPKKTNEHLDIALLETRDKLEKEPIKIADAKLGDCILISLQYFRDPYDYRIARVVPYDRRAEITELPEQELCKIYQDGRGIKIKRGEGEIVLKKPREAKFLCFTSYLDPDNTIYDGDSGSLVIQDGKLVGILISKNPSIKNVGYFTRGGELEKLLQEYKNNEESITNKKTSDLHDFIKEK